MKGWLQHLNIISNGRPASAPQPAPIINTVTTDNVVAEESKQSVEITQRCVDMFEDAVPELVQESVLETVQAEII